MLLDPRTHKPRYLYMARHRRDEGKVVPWRDPALQRDEKRADLDPRKQLRVAGPQGPLLQNENSRTCGGAG